MPQLLLNTIALDPNRWTADKQPDTELSAVLPAVVAAGFRALEVWQYHLSTLDAAGLDALVTAARDLGVEAPIVGVYPALHLEGEARERQWSELVLTAQRAQRLGTRAVKMFAGRLGSDAASDLEVERSVAFARDLEGWLADRGMALIAEAHPDTLCDSVPATRRFLEAVGGDVGVCYQPYDFVSTARTLADYRALRARVVHVHLQGRRNDAMSLLEDADIDYAAFLGALAADGFEGALSIEFVEGCVVPDPSAFRLEVVLANAQRDRAFLEAACAQVGLALDL
ncbi:sugar phosphate isomerase/epimerase family protein [Rubrivirga sp.]|uniref:sugar phosphate isomerase/epimerase family protein n=1 Tax=Rubrivirga sp. TaxID=1885344 RepID=UPI003B527760